jgi:hypothetical protein
MTNNNHFSPASEKGHFNGLVDEGEYLRQSSLYKQILPRTPSRPIRSLPTFQVGPRNLRNLRLKNSCLYSLYLCAFLWLKIPQNLRNLWLIKDLRLRKITYEKITFLCKTNPNSEKSSLT